MTRKNKHFVESHSLLGDRSAMKMLIMFTLLLTSSMSNSHVLNCDALEGIFKTDPSCSSFVMVLKVETSRLHHGKNLVHAPFWVFFLKTPIQF